MATATLKTASFGAAKAAPAKAKTEGFWTRFWNAMEEAQLRKAQREINLHLNHISDEQLRAAGFRRTLEGSKDLPFVK